MKQDLEDVKKDRDFLLLENNEMKRQIGELNNISENSVNKITGAYIWLIALSLFLISLTVIVLT